MRSKNPMHHHAGRTYSLKDLHAYSRCNGYSDETEALGRYLSLRRQRRQNIALVSLTALCIAGIVWVGRL
jgi:hypothetical protein